MNKRNQNKINLMNILVIFSVAMIILTQVVIASDEKTRIVGGVAADGDYDKSKIVNGSFVQGEDIEKSNTTKILNGALVKGNYDKVRYVNSTTVDDDYDKFKIVNGTTVQGDETRCQLVPEPGQCKANFARYYFDKTDGVCKEFSWGGCEGVVPFETIETCNNSCIDKGLHPKKVKIMPATASENAIKVLNLKKDVVVVLKNESNKSFYELSAEKDVNLFGFIKRVMAVKVEVNAENGSIEKTKKPWWSFLATE